MSPKFDRVRESKAWKGTQEYFGYDPHIHDLASSEAWLRKWFDHPGQSTVSYFRNLFPFVSWLPHYNLKWLVGDLIAGITVGLVLVPQGMSYAKIATLPIQYGLYSSFVGVAVYAIFATSKDVSIGPVAVMSLQIAKTLSKVHDERGDQYSDPVIATAVAFICGFIVLGIGLLKLGWIVEFIPAPAVSAFMTGSALNIAWGQVPKLMGYADKMSTKGSTYKLIINSLKHLPDTQRDAAYGLSGIFFLYAVRFICGRIEKRAKNPLIKQAAFFANVLRSAFVIVMLTLFSWVYLRNKQVSSVKDYSISILGPVPKGFQDTGQPFISKDLLASLGSQLPVLTIVMLLEHISIAKSFGRVNNYKIDPNQELIAIGVTNTVGTLLSAYPATGSFSRTAIKAKAGVRTPLAGWFTAATVVIAIYVFTGDNGAFKWIPQAALAAVIIHAVGDLIAAPPQVYHMWKTSPFEFLIWLASLLVNIFDDIDTGIYVAVAASAGLLLIRIAFPRGHFLGRVVIKRASETDSLDDESAVVNLSLRDVYVPLVSNGATNPFIKVEHPPPGIIIYRFDESVIYPNASHYVDVIAAYARQHTRRSSHVDDAKQGDRPWNDPGPLLWTKKAREAYQRERDASTKSDIRPILRAVVFDFSSVSHLDITSVQYLLDLRRVLCNYAGREVNFHFASIWSPWLQRALVASGFGTTKSVIAEPVEIAPIHRELAGFTGITSLDEQYHPNSIWAKALPSHERPKHVRDIDDDIAEVRAPDPEAAVHSSEAQEGAGPQKVSPPSSKWNLKNLFHKIPAPPQVDDSTVDAGNADPNIVRENYEDTIPIDTRYPESQSSDAEKEPVVDRTEGAGLQSVFSVNLNENEDLPAEPLVPPLFPRFHFDIGSAVAAAVAEADTLYPEDFSTDLSGSGLSADSEKATPEKEASENFDVEAQEITEEPRKSFFSRFKK